MLQSHPHTHALGYTVAYGELSLLDFMCECELVSTIMHTHKTIAKNNWATQQQVKQQDTMDEECEGDEGGGKLCQYYIA